MRSDPEGMTPAERAAWEAESDEIVTMLYEDGLCDDELWALEAFEYRQKHGVRLTQRLPPAPLGQA